MGQNRSLMWQVDHTFIKNQVFDIHCVSFPSPVFVNPTNSCNHSTTNPFSSNISHYIFLKLIIVLFWVQNQKLLNNSMTKENQETNNMRLLVWYPLQIKLKYYQQVFLTILAIVSAIQSII